MKKILKTGSIQLPQTKRQWEIYQKLAQYAAGLDRLPDAQEVQKDKAQSAPQGLLPMVF